MRLFLRSNNIFCVQDVTEIAARAAYNEDKGGKFLVVYADILVLLNMLVDYFLLLVCRRILRQKPPLWRQLGGALVGGLSSLYIFAEQTNMVTDLLVRAAVCVLMTLVSFGFGGKKRFFRACGMLLLVTCAYGGIMTAVWQLFRPNGMTVVNSVAYFNLSPTILIGASVAAYLLFILLSTIFSRTAVLAERCEITLFADDADITVSGLVDTGNSAEDIVGGSEVIIADRACAERLFGDLNPYTNEKIKSRYRLMPCGTVSGTGMLEGYRCDRATVREGEREIKLNKPVLAVSKTPLKDDCAAIVNPKIFY